MANNRNNSVHAKRPSGINATFIGAVFLGICILIAGISIGGGIRKLNKTLEDKQLASQNTVNTPSSMAIGQKKYLNEEEAGEYLHVTKEKIVNLITSGEITEYVRTDEGYSISVSVLDNWFDNAAYENKLRNTAGEPGNDES